MLVALHNTLKAFLKASVVPPSVLNGANVDFAIPDETFRQSLSALTLNLYLYDLRENLEMRRAETWVQRNATRTAAARRRFPAFVDCGYCITAWSPAEPDGQPVLDEHQLLGEVLRILLANPRIPRKFWDEGIGTQVPPCPSVLAQPDASRNHGEFWTALGHPPKPALTYVITLAVPLHDDDDDRLGHVVGPTKDALRIDVDQLDAARIDPRSRGAMLPHR